MPQCLRVPSFYRLKPIENFFYWIAISIFILFSFSSNSFANTNASNMVLVDTIACDPGFYQTIGFDGTLVRYEYDGFELGFEVIAVFGFQVNATSFNVLDGFMYCIATGTQRLIRFDTDGNYVDLGPLPIIGSIYVGGFDTKGNYYVCQGGANQVYKINVATRAVETLTITTNLKFRAADWAYIESQDRLYGVSGNDLYEFNPNTFEVIAYPLSGLENESPGFGGAFSAANGGVFVSNNDSGIIYFIDIIGLQAVPIIGGPSSGINDGSSCPCALPPFPAIIPANDTLCITSEMPYDVLANDLASLEEIDYFSFEVIFPPLFGSVSYNAQTGSIVYQSDDPTQADFLVYEICLDYELDICAQAIVVFEPDVITSFEETICQGDTLMFNGQGFSEEGFYEFNHPAFNGCDSIVQLNISINQNVNLDLSSAICEQDSFEFDGVYFFDSGLYEFMYTAENGCDSLVTLDLEVNTNYEEFITASICDGETFVMDGVIFDEPGNYEVAYESQFSCDSIIHIELLQREATFESFSASICVGESYILNDSIYTEEGSYVQLLNGSNGCDSTLTFTLTVNEVFESLKFEAICEGEIFTLENGTTFTEAGTYEVPFTATNGCDSILTFILDVKENFESTIVEEICDGDIYVLNNGTIFTQEDVYEINYQAANGCDSLFVLDLRVKAHEEQFLTQFICEGESFSVGDSVYTNTGNYSNLFVAANQCDSTVFLDLEVGENFSIFLEEKICEGESFPFNGMQITTSGIYEQSASAINGCDSLVTLNLEVLENKSTILDVSICEGESYVLGTTMYSEAGNYQQAFTAFNGCDSLVTLDLEIAPNFTATFTEEICTGEEIVINNISFTETGFYEIFIEGNNTCDSIIFLDLTQHEPTSFSFNEMICEGNAYIWDGQSLNEAGLYQQLYQTIHGCDSLVTLRLGVNPIYSNEMNQEICESEFFEFAGQQFSESGNYDIALTTQAGCDSLITLNLIVNENVETNLTDVICEGESVTFGGVRYDTQGDYSQQLQTSKGCDSIVNLSLVVNPIYSMSFTEEICAGESYAFNGQEYSETGLYEVGLLSQNACDSILFLDLTVKQHGFTFLDEVVCIGSAYTVGDSIYTEEGSYQNVFLASNGCDSIVNLNLRVEQIFTTTIEEGICPGDVFSLLGEDYTDVGVYEVMIQASNGCDSLIALDLSHYDTNETFEEASICEGDTYLFGDIEYAVSGNYSQSLLNQNSCDSISNLSLIVMDNFETFLFPEICQGETIEIEGEIYNETGDYEIHIPAFNGCDSALFISLVVHPLPVTNLENFTCIESDVGEESMIYVSANGCDSTVITTTFLLPPDDCFLIADVLGETLDCGIALGTFTFDFSVGTPPFTINWSGASTGSTSVNALGSFELTDLPIGNYDFEIIDANNNTIALSGEILRHQTPQVFAQVALAFGDFDVSCHGASDGSALAVAGGGTPPYSFTWSNGASGPEIFDMQAGEYSVTVLDANNCESTASVLLTEPPELILDLDVSEIECFDPTSGFVQLNPTGGVAPYTFSINNEPLQSSNEFDLLSGGSYNFTVFDANDCMKEETVFLETPTAVDVELGEDIYIKIGEEANLFALLNVQESEIETILWSDNLITNCASCLNQIVFPEETTTYTIVVDDVNGCKDTDNITIHVDRDQDIYIPNAFSPNNDGVNDVFMIFGNENAPPRVNTFQIFDRWGNQIFIANDFLANDPANGWDGSFRGELHNPGVFVYYALIEFLDGTEVLYEGDVTLMY